MNLPEHFETFFGRISVDDARLNRVRKAHMAMSRALRQDGYVDRAMFETFLQGSCAHGTLVRPLGKGTEFDIDVCCLLDLGQVPTRSKEPKPVVRWLAKRIRRIEAYRGKVKSRPRCVRVEFPGDFHIDVVPLAEDSRIGSQLYVPNVDRNSWEPTNPKGLADWYGQQNQRTNVRFVRVAKMLKHWRNQVFPKQHRPSSVGLEVLIANHWPIGASSDGAAVAGVFKNLKQGLQFSFGAPSAMNPSLRAENLLRDWEAAAFELFKNELKNAATLADDALTTWDEDRSIGLWQRLFVTRFPQRAG